MHDLAQWATIIGFPISLLGLLFAYFSLKRKNEKTFQCIVELRQEIQLTNTKIENLNDIVNLHNKYSSSGDQYHNCTITNSPIDNNQLKEEYAKGRNKNG